MNAASGVVGGEPGATTVRFGAGHSPRQKKESRGRGPLETKAKEGRERTSAGPVRVLLNLQAVLHPLLLSFDVSAADYRTMYSSSIFPCLADFGDRSMSGIPNYSHIASRVPQPTLFGHDASSYPTLVLYA